MLKNPAWQEEDSTGLNFYQPGRQLGRELFFSLFHQLIERKLFPMGASKNLFWAMCLEIFLQDKA